MMRDFVAMAKNPKGMTIGELEHRVAQCSGFVKLMTGVANNAALMIMYDCHNKIADVRDKDSYNDRPWHPHPMYRQRVKHLYMQVFRERDRYRSALKNPRPDATRFFSLSDMPDSARKKYGAVTDAQYFEFWEGTGALAYQKSQPLIGSLWNKFRLSMQAHGVGDADLVAWGCVGAAVLELAVTIWQRSTRSVHDACDGILTMEQIRKIYAPFNIARISTAWRRALTEMTPETSTYDLDDQDERNVALGVEQLEELWVNPELPFDATIQAVEDFSDDIFRTKGYAKKAMRELSEMRNEAVKDYESMKQ